jgi:iron only hydrogenase large subunit-like protein
MANSYNCVVQFDPSRCQGCMTCMHVCPTEAIRIRKGRAEKIEQRCINCAECSRVCPQSAVVIAADQSRDLSKYNYRVAIPSPVLYVQFGPDASPSMICAALKQCGFDEVESVSSAGDAVKIATEIFLKEHQGPHPIISSFCPVIVRLAQVRYPELVNHLLPVLAPREISAQNAKKRILKENGWSEEQIGALYIAPCPAEMVAIIDHPGMRRSYLDAVVSIRDLFPALSAAVQRVQNLKNTTQRAEVPIVLNRAFLSQFSGSPPKEDTLSIIGLSDVIQAFDDLQKGMLHEYSYIECFACREGCIGGCLTVENPYTARAKAIRMEQSHPPIPTVNRNDIEASYRKMEFLMDESLVGHPIHTLDEDLSWASARKGNIERVLANLPNIDCGACGAPSCRAFAKDVALGEVEQAACVFLKQQELARRVEDLSNIVKAQQGEVRQ